MRALFVINDPPYGTDRVYNALRLARALVESETNAENVAGAHRSTTDGLAAGTLAADGGLVF